LPDLAHPFYQVQAGAHRPLGVVLVGGRRTPNGHDRVTDVLLYDPSVGTDDLTGGPEVAALELADRLGIA